MNDARGVGLSGVLFSIAVALLLVASSVFASQANQSDADWFGTQGNYPFNWNYNPQTDVNASNVQRLQVSWVIPNAKAPMAYRGADSIVFTPMIVKGIVYTVTNFHQVNAIGAKDGR